jgi:hypothetical protein
MDPAILIAICCACVVMASLVIAGVVALNKDAMCGSHPTWFFCQTSAPKPNPGPGPAPGPAPGPSGPAASTPSGLVKLDDGMLSGPGGAMMTTFGGPNLATGVVAKPRSWNGKTVVPIAVHHDDFSDHLYKVLEITLPDARVFYGHVLDYCNRENPVCKGAKGYCDVGGTIAQKKDYFLIDVHHSGLSSVTGTPIPKSACITGVKYRVAGELPPTKMKASDFSGYSLCRCTKKYCDPKENGKNQGLWMAPSKIVKDCVVQRPTN